MNEFGGQCGDHPSANSELEVVVAETASQRLQTLRQDHGSSSDDFIEKLSSLFQADPEIISFCDQGELRSLSLLGLIDQRTYNTFAQARITQAFENLTPLLPNESRDL